MSGDQDDSPVEPRSRSRPTGSPDDPIPVSPKNIPEDVQQAIFLAASFKSPIPLPFQLRQYDEVSPGLAKQITDSAFKQSDHRMDLETKVVDSNIATRTEAMRLGAGLGVLSLVGSVILGIMGHTTASVTMAGLVGGGLATSYITAFFRQQSEMTAKKQKMEKIKPRNDVTEPSKPTEEAG